jgi:hypothetical protein
MQAYSPRKDTQYFDDQNNPQELEMLEGGEDLKSGSGGIANNTARQMAAQLIATISGQTNIRAWRLTDTVRSQDYGHSQLTKCCRIWAWLKP